jgi:hypothetical protein
VRRLTCSHIADFLDIPNFPDFLPVIWRILKRFYEDFFSLLFISNLLNISKPAFSVLIAAGECTDLLEPVDHGLLHVHGMGLHVNEPLAQGPANCQEIK